MYRTVRKTGNFFKTKLNLGTQNKGRMSTVPVPDKQLMGEEIDSTDEPTFDEPPLYVRGISSVHPPRGHPSPVLAVSSVQPHHRPFPRPKVRKTNFQKDENPKAPLTAFALQKGQKALQALQELDQSTQDADANNRLAEFKKEYTEKFNSIMSRHFQNMQDLKSIEVELRIKVADVEVNKAFSYVVNRMIDMIRNEFDSINESYTYIKGDVIPLILQTEQVSSPIQVIFDNKYKSQNEILERHVEDIEQLKRVAEGQIDGMKKYKVSLATSRSRGRGIGTGFMSRKRRRRKNRTARK